MGGSSPLPGQGGEIRTDAQAGNWGSGGLRNFQVWDNDLEEIKSVVMSMKPGNVRSAGTAYSDVADRMHETIRLLYEQSRKLAEHWGGPAAVAAMEQLQTAYDAANEIYRTSRQTGGALEAHAGMQDSWQQNMRDVDTSGGTLANIAAGAAGLTGIGALRTANNERGHELKQELQRQTVESNGNFPAQIQAEMPSTAPGSANPWSSPAGGGLGGGLGGGGALPGGGAGAGGLASDLPGAGGLPGGGSGAGGLPGGGGLGGDLPGGGSGAGNLPGGGGGTLPGGGGGAGGFGGGNGTELAGLGAGGGGGLGAGGLPGGGLGAGAGAGSLPGAGAVPGAGAGLGAGAGGPAGAGLGGRFGPGGVGVGMGGMPMGAGAGHGGDEEAHERSTWLVEDEDVWGGAGDATPPVIGGAG